PQLDHRQLDERFRRQGALLPVLAEPAASAQPRERPLDRPADRKLHPSLRAGGPAHDRDVPIGVRLDPQVELSSRLFLTISAGSKKWVPPRIESGRLSVRPSRRDGQRLSESGWSGLTSSKPLRVVRACRALGVIVFLRNSTEPSANAKFVPLG